MGSGESRNPLALYANHFNGFFSSSESPLLSPNSQKAHDPKMSEAN